MSRVLILLLGLLLGLGGCDGSSYTKKGLQWSYDGTPFKPDDPKSFRTLDKHFARDAKRGYCRGSIIDGSDGASFEALSDHEARDLRTVYYCDTYRKGQEYWAIQYVRVRPIQDAHAPTYRVLGLGYARDRTRAYEDGVGFTVRDAASFEPLGSQFARDSERGYFARAEIPGSHGPTFSLIDGGYARDRTSAYHGHIETDTPNRGPHPVVRTLRGADTPALRVLGRGYASDAKHVWYQGAPVLHADAPSFAVVDDVASDTDASDRTGSWKQGRKAAAATR
jgi:hypothetical protein